MDKDFSKGFIAFLKTCTLYVGLSGYSLVTAADIWRNTGDNGRCGILLGQQNFGVWQHCVRTGLCKGERGEENFVEIIVR